MTRLWVMSVIFVFEITLSGEQLKSIESKILDIKLHKLN